MANRLVTTVQQLAAKKKKALVAFLTAGYPDLKTTEKLVLVLEKNGADIVELGVPFSDPIADGRTIQFSSQKALERGVSFDDVLGLVRAIRRKSSIPLVLMGYLNPLFHQGLERSVRKARACGADGFIIPDSIPEESAELRRACTQEGLSLVFLAAPNTPQERLSYIDRQSSGFVYVVSLTGVTGGRKELPSSARKFLRTTRLKIRRHPRFVGFGISGPQQVRELKRYADGVIVGSAFIDILRSGGKGTAEQRIAAFTRSLRGALDS